MSCSLPIKNTPVRNTLSHRNWTSPCIVKFRELTPFDVITNPNIKNNAGHRDTLKFAATIIKEQWTVWGLMHFFYVSKKIKINYL